MTFKGILLRNHIELKIIDKILEKIWEYFLYKDGEKYFLEVVCGEVGIYTIKFELNEIETERYLLKGEKYIEELALFVNDNSSKYFPRNIID